MLRPTRRGEDVSAPAYGSILVGGRCSAQCNFCVGRHVADRSMPHVGRDWRAFLARLAQDGIGEVSVSGVNSDPLLCLDTPAIVARAHELGLRVGLHTNGMGDPAVALAADKTTLSLHSFRPHRFEAITSCPAPLLERVVAFAAAVAPRRPLKLSATYVPENADEISGGDWFRSAAGLGVKRAVIRRCVGGSMDPRLPPGARRLPAFAGQKVAEFEGVEITVWDYAVANRRLAPVSLWPDNAVRGADAWEALSPRWREE